AEIFFAQSFVSFDPVSCNRAGGTNQLSNILGIADGPRQSFNNCAHRFGKEERSVLQIAPFSIVFHFGGWALFLSWDLELGIWSLRQRPAAVQCPWPKIIQQN